MRYLLVCLLLFSGYVNAGGIYKCIGDHGEVSYSQKVCGDETSLVIQPVMQHDQGQGIRDSEVQWLRTRALARDSSSAAISDNGVTKDDSKQAGNEKCWKKRQQLLDVNRELKQGYRANQGKALRNKRESLTDYLGRFCS